MKKHSFLSKLYELLSSMRFAVGLLVIVAVASIIGTVLKQNEPYPNYLIEFGGFWFEAWRVIGLYDVYHAPWFLLILGFLVTSTSICIMRNTPGFLRDMRSYRERARRISLLNMHHRHTWTASGDIPSLVERARAVVSGLGYRVRCKEHPDGVTIAAKAGSYQRLGYFLAHIAIVLICVGGLMDGNLPYQVQSWLGWKHPEMRDIPQTQVPAISRLSPGNLSFRGNVTLAEGQAADVVFLNAGRGYLVQDLPFYVELKKFYIEHYSTGQPKRFASYIVVTDKQTGQRVAQTIEVNKPLTVNGITIYQASFGDGGSPLDLMVWSDAGGRPLVSVSQRKESLELEGKPYALELGEFRLFNIESMGAESRQDSFRRAMTVKQPKQVENVGPSITYKLRDANGQAQEFQSYMSPIVSGGRTYWVISARDDIDATFQFVRIPLGQEASVHRFMQLRAELAQPESQEAVSHILADQMLGAQTASQLREPFRQSTLRIVQTFVQGGFPALESLVDSRVPEAQRPLMLETNLKILLAFAWQADVRAGQHAGAPPRVWNENEGRYLTDALQAMSEWRRLRIPGLVQLNSFTDVKASGLQLTRSPGKTLVYLGSLLLVMGTFIMFYIRERRIWIYLASGGEAILAMSANRKNDAFEQEFQHLKTHLPQWLEEPLDEPRA